MKRAEQGAHRRRAQRVAPWVAVTGLVVAIAALALQPGSSPVPSRLTASGFPLATSAVTAQYGTGTPTCTVSIVIGGGRLSISGGGGCGAIGIDGLGRFAVRLLCRQTTACTDRVRMYFNLPSGTGAGPARRTLVVAPTTATLPPQHSSDVHLRLNPAGLAWARRQGTIEALLAVTEMSGKADAPQTATASIPLHFAG